MKIGSVKITAALSVLDPASTGLVNVLHLTLPNLKWFAADDVTMADGMVFARSANDADLWLYAPAETISGFMVEIDRNACLAAKVDPTLAAVLAHSLTR